MKIALFVVKIALFHCHIHHTPSSPVCVCANEQPRPNPIFGRDIKDTAGRRAVAAHGELMRESLHKERWVSPQGTESLPHAANAAPLTVP